MPYFNHVMARSIKLSQSIVSMSEHDSQHLQQTPKTEPKPKIRSLPGTNKDATKIYQLVDKSLAEKYRLAMTQRKLLFMESLLRAQIKLLTEKTMSAYSTEAFPNAFRAYKIDKNVLRYSNANHKLYMAKSVNKPGMNMAAAVYSRSSLDPSSSMYLKVLRHLSYKHPYIVHIHELFFDRDNVYIFQEWASNGNLAEYMEHSEPLSEQQAVTWTKQLYRALDFLGDHALAHRSIKPKHLVLQPQFNGEVWLKLTGFAGAIIYWNVDTNDIQFCPCLPVAKQQQDGANFQPLEIYGNSDEVFDPIFADIWSFGACVYYMLGKQYPYNAASPSDDIDSEIQQNIHKLDSLSAKCKEFLFSTLRGNANDRMPFDYFESHPWIRAHSGPSAQRATTSKKL